MGRSCQLTGASVRTGHKVSHSNRKSSRTFQPNLQRVTLRSDALRREFSLRITTRALRSVQKHGGLDNFLLRTSDRHLSEEALQLRERVRRALGGRATGAREETAATPPPSPLAGSPRGSRPPSLPLQRGFADTPAGRATRAPAGGPRRRARTEAP